MKILKTIKSLSKFELLLWGLSAIAVILSCVFSPDRNYLSLAASLIGVSALIFVAKGLVLGQVLTVVFSVFYGIISFHFDYYGEMITYLGMSAPIAVFSIISWLRHPFKKSDEVEIARLTRKGFLLLLGATALVTFAFYFILKALNTANLIISTVSVATSFLAASLTFLRSPYYAVAYALNDVVLIVLWVLAAIEDISYLPMIACFLAFLANDLYGFYNWKRLERAQNEARKEQNCSDQSV